MLPLHIFGNMCYGSETENKYQRPQSFLQTRDVPTKRQYTNFLSSLALDSSSIVYLRQTSSAATQTMFVAVHPKIEFENCITVSFNLFLAEHKGKTCKPMKSFRVLCYNRSTSPSAATQRNSWKRNMHQAVCAISMHQI